MIVNLGQSPKLNLEIKEKMLVDKTNSKDGDVSPNAKIKMLVKVLSDQKKECERLKELSESLLDRIKKLEVENMKLSDKLKAQESLFIKTFSSPPKRQLVISPGTANKGGLRKQNITFGEKKNNYQDNLKQMVHHKYLKKMESQEIEHQKQMAELKLDFTAQIEDMTELISNMSQEITNIQMDSIEKCRNMFDIILEKDVRIEELEQQEDSQKDNGLQNNTEIYDLKTKYSALKTNLKQRDRRINELEDDNKKLYIKLSKMHPKNNKFIKNYDYEDNSPKTKIKERDKNTINYKQNLIKLINI